MSYCYWAQVGQMPCIACSRCRNGQFEYFTADCLVIRYGRKIAGSILLDYSELNQKRFDHIFISDLFNHRWTDRRRTDKYTTRRTQCCFIFTLR